MLVDIRGKINEKKLAYSNTLLPLYEAIVNSIQAIEDGSATKPGLIDITLVRSPQTDLPLNGQPITPSILDFTIRDNGCGFTEQNYESFNFAHSTYKEKKGGKGIGRFVWLRAFTTVEIESRYPEGSKFFYRKFTFEPTKDGIENHSHEEVAGVNNRFTEVCLKALKQDYQKWCNTDAEDIAIKIIEHCFVYFLRDDCPRITLHDGDQKIVVNDLFGVFTKGQV